MSNRREPTITGIVGPECPPHHWHINGDGQAHCIKPGCQARRFYTPNFYDLVDNWSAMDKEELRARASKGGQHVPEKVPSSIW